MEHGWVLRVLGHDLFLIYRIPIRSEAVFRGAHHSKDDNRVNAER